MSHILCCANSSERDGYVPRWWRRCHGWRTAALGPCRWLAIHSALEIHDALGLLFSLSLSLDGVSVSVHPLWFPHQTPLGTTTAPLAASAYTRPRSLLSLPFLHGGRASAELFGSASADTHHVWCYLLAALHGSQDGSISSLSFIDERNKMLCLTVSP